jgi:hypothetical protein
MSESFTPPEARPDALPQRASHQEIADRVATANMLVDTMPVEYRVLWNNFKSYAEGTVPPPIPGWTQEDCQEIFRQMPQPHPEVASS